ncbi:MAG: L-lysine dehydrogenase, partial [Desulfobulbaceae bacterium]|nr:L-lysine dehydrogenase [Desulfobulbaceae bacterium]
HGNLVREEFVNAYRPVGIAGRRWRAISWTTAASACAVIELVSNGTLPDKGFIKQEEIDLEKFMETKNGRLYSGRAHGGKLEG